MNIIPPVTHSNMLKILKFFIFDPSHKVIMDLNSISYAVFAWAVFILSKINRRCPQMARHLPIMY
jgi:hypothetical protein